jgi:hypothetical protein
VIEAAARGAVLQIEGVCSGEFVVGAGKNLTLRAEKHECDAGRVRSR